MSDFDHDCEMVHEVLSERRMLLAPVAGGIFRHKGPTLLVAEGSSLLMPGGFVRSLARAWGWPHPIDAVGGRTAKGMDNSAAGVICISNSGRSREIVDCMPSLPADAVAILGQPGGPLCRLPHVIVLPRPEKAVPATASVFATCLILGHALASAADRTVPLLELRMAMRDSLVLEPDVPSAQAVRRVFWIGGHTGVGSELALKTMETTGLVGVDLPGSLALHGIHEVLEPGDLVVGLDVPPTDEAEIRRRVESVSGATLLLPPCPSLGVWSPLVHLSLGWRILRRIANDQGRDPAYPRRATKIGNPAS
jgi:fructoselysine-6-P-deglycase FrlB-like protein